ncbi:MAG: hypothetical protein U9N76_08670, partial [Candidatus Marinimicrobia bacterium]|nr:hypothetical protein [Candidatus Neomarinimicrobiota bacterium]
MKNKMKNISKNLLILLIIIVVLLPNLYSQNNTIKFYQDSLKTDFEIKKKNSRRWLLGTIANLGLTTGFHFLGNNSYSKYEEAKSPSEVEKYWDQTMNYDKAFDISVGTASVMLFQSIRAKVKNQSIQSEMEKIPLQYISTVSEKKNLVCSSSIIDDDSNLILLCNEKKLERKSFNRQKNDNSIFLYKVNMEGQIKWKHHYNTKNYEFGNSIIKTMDSGFLIAGISRFTPIDNFNVLLIKNDSVGNIEWQKTFEITGQSEIMFVEQSNDSVYNIIGKSTTSYRVIHWFLKIDSNGEILNKTEFLVNNIFFDYSIIPMKNGYIIGGSYRIKDR